MKPGGILSEVFISSTTHLDQRYLNQLSRVSLFRWRSSFGWYLGAACLAYFADGRCSVPLAAWLFPGFMLRFVRLQRPLAGLVITYGTLLVSRWFAFRGMVPLPGILFLLFALISSFAALTPYLLDRLFAVRLKGIANSLVFPATLVSVQFLYEHGPFGSWGSTAYPPATMSSSKASHSSFGNFPDQFTGFVENNDSTKLSWWFFISPWENGQSVRTSMRPARDSEIFGSNMTFAEPVSRNCPGWRLRSMAALITGKSSGTC